jgi:hypothetical protein
MDLSTVCLPVFTIAFVFVAAIVFLLTKRHKTGAIPRSNLEMTRMASGKENTYLFDPNHGILGKMVSEPVYSSGRYMDVQWSAIGDFSGKKNHLPQALPDFCFDIPPMRLSPACGPQKYVQFILPYDEKTKLLFLKPYIREIHNLKIELVEKQHLWNEAKKIIMSERTVTGALDMINELERRGGKRKPTSALLTAAETTSQKQEEEGG